MCILTCEGLTGEDQRLLRECFATYPDTRSLTVNPGRGTTPWCMHLGINNWYHATVARQPKAVEFETLVVEYSTNLNSKHGVTGI